MKNTIKLKAIQRIAGFIALMTVIGITMTACGPGGGGFTFEVTNENVTTITNIKVYSANYETQQKSGGVLYNSGEITIATNDTHTFTVSGLQTTLIGTAWYFIRVEGFNTPPFRALKKGIKPRIQIPYENNIPRPFRAGLLIEVTAGTVIDYCGYAGSEHTEELTLTSSGDIW